MIRLSVVEKIDLVILLINLSDKPPMAMICTCWAWCCFNTCLFDKLRAHRVVFLFCFVIYFACCITAISLITSVRQLHWFMGNHGEQWPPTSWNFLAHNVKTLENTNMDVQCRLSAFNQKIVVCWLCEPLSFMYIIRNILYVRSVFAKLHSMCCDSSVCLSLTKTWCHNIIILVHSSHILCWLNISDVSWSGHKAYHQEMSHWYKPNDGMVFIVIVVNLSLWYICLFIERIITPEKNQKVLV